MTREPFKPAGVIARWCTIYELLRQKDINDVLTFDEAGEALDLHPTRDKELIRQAIRRAGEELLRVNKRAIGAKRKVGYVIVPADKHVELSERKRRSADRATKKSYALVVHTDRNLLDREGREKVDRHELVLGQQIAFNREVARRLRDHERALVYLDQKVDQNNARTADEVAAMERRLKEHEARLAELEQGDKKAPGFSAA